MINKNHKSSLYFFIYKTNKVFFRRYILAQILKLKSYYYFQTVKIKLENNVSINQPPYNCVVGKDIIIFPYTIFEFGNKARFKIGSNSIISYGVVISCQKEIIIGNDVQIGEYTSIRDTTHDYSDFGYPMKYNNDISKEVYIGNNVWIGRGCIILPGTIIEDGVVVGANSVVKGVLKKNGIYGGVPIEFIKSRLK
jgi:acetyltransferase-like isoleucine patch superfamily enzyme